MLNYFLLQLAGPQRESLTVKDPEKYEFKPKQLLKQVPWIERFTLQSLLSSTSILVYSSLRFLYLSFHCSFPPSMSISQGATRNLSFQLQSRKMAEHTMIM
jgi:hypothetical protein